MEARTVTMQRRAFVERFSAGVAALTPPMLGAFVGSCRRNLGIPDLHDAAALRRWGERLHGKLVLAGDAEYEQTRLGWNRAFDRRPAAIVRCAHLDDVVRTVELCRGRDAIVAVRGGGHSMAGQSSCDGGVLLDLGGFRTVVTDATNRQVRAGAGVRVGELNATTLAKGLAVPSGGCPDVGIAGLTLGGGETALMSKYGAACDNVLAAEVVTADGRVLTASAEENSDLFWAIRGGSGNFGVVTSFTLRAYPITEWLSASFSFPLSRGLDALRTFRDQMLHAPDELMTSTIMSPAPAAAVNIAMTYCGAAEAGRRVVDRLRSALRPATASTQWTAYGADFTMQPAPFGGTGCFLATPGDDAIRAWVSILDRAPPRGFTMANEYRGAVTRVAPDAMAFPWRQPGWSVWIGSQWTMAEERAAVVAWVSRARELLRPFSSGVYLNVLDDEGFERARESYGANYARLRTIKAKYDPTNFFRLNQNIPPAA